MQLALAHFVGLLFAAGMVFLGRLILRHPDRVVRAFHLGTEPALGKKFALLWAKSSGWLFTVIGTFGVILYLVMIPIELGKR